MPALESPLEPPAQDRHPEAERRPIIAGDVAPVLDRRNGHRHAESRTAVRQVHQRRLERRPGAEVGGGAVVGQEGAGDEAGG